MFHQGYICLFRMSHEIMKKIYLVEDDYNLRELICYLLTDHDYEVEAFANATSFKERISGLDIDPDLILMDIMLPDGNGVELCRAIKADDKTSSIPVILMSAHADPSITQNSGAIDFIAKPFDVDQFYSRLNKYLN